MPTQGEQVILVLAAVAALVALCSRSNFALGRIFFRLVVFGICFGVTLLLLQSQATMPAGEKYLFSYVVGIVAILVVRKRY